MRNKFIIGALASLLTILCTFWYINRTEPPTKEGLIRNTFEATCTVDSTPLNGYGTGVLLDTGYVLTAAHIVDTDRDGELSPIERHVTLGFTFGDVPGSVIFLGKKDFAIIKPNFDLSGHSNLVVAKREERLGEKIYTVGATDGRAPHITNGFISLPEGQHSRASCFISGGNSGGAIISEQNEHLGVVVAVGVRRHMERIILQKYEDGKMKQMTMIVPRSTEVNSLCLFVPARQIRSELDNRGFSYLLDVSVDETPLLRYLHDDPMIMTLQLTVLKLWLFLVAVAYVRRHLFS